MVSKRWLILLVFAFGVLAGYFIFGFKTRGMSEGKIKPINTSDPNCVNRVSLESLNGVGGEGHLVLCANDLRIWLAPVTDDNYKPVVFEDKQSFPDLFVFPNEGNRYLEREVVVFPKSHPRFFAVVSHYDGVTAILQAFGVYRVEDGKAVRVFKSGFGDIQGRTVLVKFSSMESEFEVSFTRNEGGVIIDGVEKYVWNDGSGSFGLR